QLRDSRRTFETAISTVSCISGQTLASALMDAGKLELALPMAEEALTLCKSKLGIEHPDTLRSMNELARAYQAAGKTDLALPLFEETLRLRKEVLGAGHPNTLTSMNNLASAYQSNGNLIKALALLEETLQLRKEVLGAEHRDTLGSLNNLATAYQAAGKVHLAIPLFEEALKLVRTKLGPDHPSTITVMSNLAEAHMAGGDESKALPILQEILDLTTAKLGNEHLQSLGSLSRYAQTYVRMKDFTKAFELSQSALNTRRMQSPREAEERRLRASFLLIAASSLIHFDRADEAEPMAREAVAIRQELMPDKWGYFNALSHLGESLLGHGKLAEAEPLLRDGYLGMKERAETMPAAYKATIIREANQRLVKLYESLKQSEDVSRWQTDFEQFQTELEKQDPPSGR
ncbi:MAG: tetratricopeptide repeat-containing protein, partial [Planctomyces sp.]|nr:tetratricopeptide repeat-containing protein [Planctomyces sp.]